MKNYVKRNSVGVFVESEIKINKSEEWTLLQAALRSYINEQEEAIKFFEKCLSHCEDQDEILEYKHSLEFRNQEKNLAKNALNDLVLENEIKI